MRFCKTNPMWLSGSLESLNYGEAKANTQRIWKV